MTLRSRTCACAVAALLFALPAQAQQAPPSATASAFLAEARSCAERYRDLAVAIAEGYRLVGSETPDMGQHWVHPVRVLDGRLDPVSPAILVYTVIDTSPTLVGVAYALPIPPGGAPPDEPVGKRAWHAHWKGLDVENMRPSHSVAFEERRVLQIAVLHAWIGIENPSGPFAPSNWALPFVRARIPVPDSFPVAAARALALSTFGVERLAEQIRILAGPADVDTSALREVLARASASVEAGLVGRENAELTAQELARLAREWSALRPAVVAALGSGAGAVIHALWRHEWVP